MLGKTDAVGLPWFYRQDYGRILEIMEDAAAMPERYDQWLKQAEAFERQVKRAGKVPVRAIVDPGEFPAWCRARGLKIDGKARVQFANEAAYRQPTGPR